MKQPPIIVTERDYDRIDALMKPMGQGQVPGLAELRDELDRARVVSPEDVPRDVITMNSTACFENTITGQRFELTLVYPQDMDGTPGKVSILAPVGSALLGLSVGQAIEWQVPGGRTLSLRVLEVRDQPEFRLTGTL